MHCYPLKVERFFQKNVCIIKRTFMNKGQHSLNLTLILNKITIKNLKTINL